MCASKLENRIQLVTQAVLCSSCPTQLSWAEEGQDTLQGTKKFAALLHEGSQAHTFHPHGGLDCSI